MSIFDDNRCLLESVSIQMGITCMSYEDQYFLYIEK